MERASNEAAAATDSEDAARALGVLERFPVGDILFAPHVPSFQKALLRALLVPDPAMHRRCLGFYWKLFREVCA